MGPIYSSLNLEDLTRNQLHAYKVLSGMLATFHYLLSLIYSCDLHKWTARQIWHTSFNYMSKVFSGSDMKLLMKVCRRLGVTILRQHLLQDSSDIVELSEAFGQSEALCTRLKHIIGLSPSSFAS